MQNLIGEINGKEDFIPVDTDTYRIFLKYAKQLGMLKQRYRLISQIFRSMVIDGLKINDNSIKQYLEEHMVKTTV